MELKNDIQLRIYAEDHIRAMLLEAENYRMLSQIRKRYRSGISLRLHAMISGLARSMIAFGREVGKLWAFLGKLIEVERGIG